jgi:large subunit ribosomal protein L17
MCLIELVDFNTVYGAEATAKKTTRRSRSKGKTAGAEGGEVATDNTDAAEEAPKAKKAAPKKKKKDEE